MKQYIIKIGRRLKAWYYIKKFRLKNASRLAYFCGPFKISRDVVLEDFVYIGPYCEIYPNVTIKKYTMLANNVSIMGGDHRYDVVGLPIAFSGRSGVLPTTIGVDCWIGAHAIIKCGVNIADGCVVAMGSVVTKDTEPYGIYAGVPARRVKERFSSQTDMEKHISRILHMSNEDAEKYILRTQELDEVIIKP